MIQLYYLAIALTWITLYMCVRHMYGVVVEYAHQNNISRIATVQSLAFVVTVGVLFGGAATYGMNYVYTLHRLAML